MRKYLLGLLFSIGLAASSFAGGFSILHVGSADGNSSGPVNSLSLDFVAGSYIQNGVTASSFANYLSTSGSTFARTGAGGYDLALTTLFSNNVARITSAGLLIEPQSTNFIIQSQYAATWGAADITIAANTIIAPTGATTAAKFTEDAVAATAHQATQFTVPSTLTVGPAIIRSAYAKRSVGSRNLQLFNFDSAFSSQTFGNWDLSTGVVHSQSTPNGAASAATVVTTAAAQSYFRFSYASTRSAPDTAFSPITSMTDGTFNPSYNGDGTSAIAIFGDQFEQISATGWYATNPSSYIPTTTAAATRGADVFTISIPVGLTQVLVTFDDNSTQTVSGLSGSWVVPTNLNRPQIKTLFFSVSTSVSSLTDPPFYSPTAFGVPPANKWYYFNNTFGKGSFIDGVDFSLKMLATPSTFPNGATMEWTWPASGGTGLGAFAYGYAEIILGRGETGINNYNVVGPWPQAVSLNSALTITYNLTLGGNLNSYDTLIDTYVTNDAAGTAIVAEISFFPQSNFISGGLSSITVHTFSFGEAKVGIQGTQICVYPTSGGGTVNRSILASTIDIKEIISYIVSTNVGGKGAAVSAGFIQGIQFGAEMQVPNVSLNTAPYIGSLRFNSLSFIWNFLLERDLNPANDNSPMWINKAA